MSFSKTLREKAFAARILDHIAGAALQYIDEFDNNIRKALKNQQYGDKKFSEDDFKQLILAAIVLDMQIIHNALGPYAFANIRKHVLEILSNTDYMSTIDVEQSFYRYQSACDSARDRNVLPIGHDPLENSNLSSVLYDEIHLPHVGVSGGPKVQSPVVHLAIVDFFQNVTGISKHMLESYRIKS